VVDSVPLGVDTPADLERVRALFSAANISIHAPAGAQG